VVDLVDFSTRGFLAYILILMRVGGLFVFAPILSSPVIPGQIRLYSAMVIALALVPVISPVMPVALTLPFLVKAAVSETAVGLLIGYAANLVFVAAQLGGMQIDQQIGLAIGSVFNPLVETQDSLIGQFYFLFTMFIFLGINGHHVMLAALVGSFPTVPVGAAVLSGKTLDMLITLSGTIFTVAFALSAPMVLALFLTTVAMGFLARTVPQMNILIVGFPVRIVVGLATMAFTLPAVGYFLAHTLGAIMASVPALVAG
jgi:flagellar biosynthesis protein FliR